MDRERWVRLCVEVDLEVAGLWRKHRLAHPVTAAQIAVGFSNLAELRGGREPAYGETGTAAAYVLLYMVQRTASLVLALEAADLPAGPLRVLDIGGGTGATPLALRLLNRQDDLVTCAEPSAEMRSFIELQSALHSSICATMEDLLEQQTLAGERYDLIVMSACLPYGWRPGVGRAGKAEFGAAIRNRLQVGGIVVIVEPPAKKHTLDAAAEGLRLADLRVVSVSAATLVEGRALRQPAVRVTRLLVGLTGRLRATRELTRAGAKLLGPPWPISTTAKEPDLVLIARARESVFRPPGARWPAVRPPGIRRGATPPAAERAKAERPIRGWVIAAAVVLALGVAAVAAWAPYTFWR